MTKDVILTIKGLQFVADEEGDGTPEPMEIITSATYYEKNGRHYILYDEVMEGFAEVTKNRIKIDPKSIDITKKGVTNVHMLFEKEKKNMSCYYTPYGSIMMGLDAKEIEVKETEDLIQVKVEYALEVNYEHLADCNIQISVQAKGKAPFMIR